jgi:hypothetical protein
LLHSVKHDAFFTFLKILIPDIYPFSTHQVSPLKKEVRILKNKMFAFMGISLFEMHACPIETLLHLKHPPFALPQKWKV